MKKLAPIALILLVLLTFSACSTSMPKAVTDTKTMQDFLRDLEVDINDEFVPMSALPDALDPAAERTAEELELETFAEEVFRLTNLEREKSGLTAFTQSVELTKTAKARAAELLTAYNADHTRPDGGSCFTAFKDNGVDYRNAAENIARGYKTPAAVVEALMDSGDHRANILDTKLGTLGVGVARGTDGKLYWVQDFTN